MFTKQNSIPPRPRLCATSATATVKQKTVTVEHCQHKWCRTCIRDAFENAIGDGPDWPPKCCQHEIALANANQLMTEDLRSRYTTKAIEWGTVDCTFCWQKSCSAFIPPQNISNVHNTRRGPCPSRPCVTCTACKQQYHEEESCPENSEEVVLLRDLAEKENWRKCFSCGKLVELNKGCYHIT